MIQQQTIDQIFSAARVEEVVGEFVKLKRTGKDFSGLCPFHNEKTPSFKVSPALGIYKCFGCGKGGNVVDFVMEHEKLSYPEALKQLANKYHIEISEDYSNKEELSEQVLLRESLYSAMEFARKYFKSQLETESGLAIGRSYFKERGINEITIDDFDLGYAHDDWHHFTEHAVKNGLDLPVLLKAGLVKQKQNTPENSENVSDYYDAYRGRVIFPIHGSNGKILGFGGRQLKKEEKSPKYINSPENEIYHKSKILYGLYQARHDLRQRDDCFLVEGYMDVVMLHQSGIKNVVATSGTALTKDQVKLVRRFTDNVTLLYDGDKAGLKAALRGLDLILEEGLNAKVVVFPEGEDPDSYCRKLGGQGLDDFITTNKKDVILFMTDLLLEEHGKTPSGISQTAHHIVETLNKIPDPIKRNAYIRLAAQTLDVDEELLFGEARKLSGRATRTRNLQASKKQVGILLPKVKKDPQKIREEGDKELSLLASLIKYGERQMTDDIDVAGFVFAELQSESYEFENAFAGKIILEAADHYKTTGHLDRKFFVQHPETAKIVADELAKEYVLSPLWKEQYDISVQSEADNFKEEISANLNYLKLFKVDEVLKKNELKIKDAPSEEEALKAQQTHARLLRLRSEIASYLGNIVLK